MNSTTSKRTVLLSWVLQLVVAAVLGQTLFFKFTGAAESKALFDLFGAEPFGRYLAGAAELVAVILLLVPRTAAYGAILALGTILPAIVLHLTKLGVSIDPVALGNPELEPLAGPSLFLLALVVFLLSAGIVFIRREQLPFIARNP